MAGVREGMVIFNKIFLKINILQFFLALICNGINIARYNTQMKVLQRIFQ